MNHPAAGPADGTRLPDARVGADSRRGVRRLIVTADDFGLHEAVNQAVQQATVAGVLSAASLMVAAPATDDAVRVARETPGLRTGLHLVLTDGWSVLSPREIPDLVDGERRFRNDMVVDSFRWVSSSRVRQQLAAEVRAQFGAFVATGLVLDHVNAHKHFHLHPGVLGLILQIGREFGVTAVRVPHEPYWFARRQGVAAAASSVLLRPWIALMKARLRRAGVLYNDQVFGISCSGNLHERTLLAIIEELPPGVTEIYLHPAVRTSQPLTASMGDYHHSDELAGLLSARVQAAVHATGVRCGGFSDLL